MKLSISNIAWDASRMDEFLKVVSGAGCDGLELSPSMVWPEPASAAERQVRDLGKKIRDRGLEISSMHSLTYPHPELTFFDSGETRDKLIEYIIALGRLAGELGIPVMVFGSARSRRIGSRDRPGCLKVMAAAFRRMAEGLNPLGVTLLIEPLSKRETDCVNNAGEAVEIIKMVDHPNFALHVDLKSSFEEREDYGKVWSDYGRFIRHCHVANPGLKAPGPGCAEHYKAARAIKASGYNGYISLEIERSNDPSVIRNALAFVRQVYL